MQSSFSSELWASTKLQKKMKHHDLWSYLALGQSSFGTGSLITRADFTPWLQEAREHIALWGVPLDSLSGDKIQQWQVETFLPIFSKYIPAQQIWPDWQNLKEINLQEK